MKAPKSFAGQLVAGGAVLAVGAGLGALAGWEIQKPNGQLAQGTGAALGGAFGGLLTSYAALLVGARDKSRWHNVGNAAALLGFGGMTVMAVKTAVGPGGVFAGLLGPAPAGGGQLPAASGPAAQAPPTGSVVSMDSGGGGGSSF